MENKAGFKVGDKVGYLVPATSGLESLRGLRGTVKYVYDTGAEVEFKTNRGAKTYALANEDMIKANPTVPTTPREIANDKNNVWAIIIQPSPYDREVTWANLYINGRKALTFTVSRWSNEDKYDVGTAAYEVIKKMFDIKDKEIEKVDDTVVKESKCFNGKVVCIKDSLCFTKGKIYNVVDGIIRDDAGAIYRRFANVEEINRRMDSQFIEVVE